MFKRFVKLLTKKIPVPPEIISAKHQEQRHETVKLKTILKTLNPEDYTNFIWLSILKPNERFNAVTLSILRKLNIQESHHSLEVLAQKNLLMKSAGRDEYYMHESLIVFACHLLTSQKKNNTELSRLGVKWTDAHQKLILSFQDHHVNAVNTQDIYFIKNLYWHLQEAKWEDKLHTIISHTFPLHQWKNQISNDIFSCHLEKIHLLELAEDNCRNSYENNPSENLLLLTKYKLMKNTQAYIFQNIPVHWVKTLVETKVWPEQYAISYLEAQENSEEKAEKLEILQNIFSSDKVELLMNIITDIGLDSAQAKGISSIFHKLDFKGKKTALGQLSRIKSEMHRAMGLASIAPHIPVPLMHHAFTLTQTFQNEEFIAVTLEKFIPNFTAPLQRKSLEVIKTIKDPNVKFNILCRLVQYFPTLVSDILELRPEVVTDYTKLSMTWNLSDKQANIHAQILELVNSCPSDLDKVLFLTDLMSPEEPEQIQAIWAIASSFENESLWVNLIVELLPYLDEEKIARIMTRMATLKTDELIGELCIQLCPFAKTSEQSSELYRIVQNIQNLHIKGKTASQILDFIPEALNLVHKTLQSGNDPHQHLDIKINLLEHDPNWGESVLDSIRTLPDETLKTHFLHQAIDLLPNHLVPNLIHLINEIHPSKQRESLLNALTPRLSSKELTEAMVQFIDRTYPAAEFKNISKQIHRNYWESSIKNSEPQLNQAMIAQLSQLKISSQTQKSDNILEEIFNLPTPSNQSKILNLCLHEIQWETVQPKNLLKILTLLSQGKALDLLQNLPRLTQGIEAIFGAASLPAYGNICAQLSQPQQHPASINHQNTQNIYHIADFPALWRETA